MRPRPRSLAANVRRSDPSSCSVELGHPGSGRPSALGPAAEPARSKRPGGRGGPVNRADGLLSIGRGPVDSLEFALMRQRAGRSSRSGGRTPVDPGEVQSIGRTDSCRSGGGPVDRAEFLPMGQGAGRSSQSGGRTPVDPGRSSRSGPDAREAVPLAGGLSGQPRIVSMARSRQVPESRQQQGTVPKRPLRHRLRAWLGTWPTSRRV